jgi:hypothetical protein
MGEKVQMSGWVKGPMHGWKAVHKTRQDADADVVEELYVERSFYALIGIYVAACVAAWWWQTMLDSWARGALLAFAIILTIYLVVMAAAALIFQFVGRFIRNA